MKPVLCSITETIALPEIKVGSVQHDHAAHLRFRFPNGYGVIINSCPECVRVHGPGSYAPWHPGELRPNCPACLGENEA